VGNGFQTPGPAEKVCGKLTGDLLDAAIKDCLDKYEK
jgi:hypothetical protein